MVKSVIFIGESPSPRGSSSQSLVRLRRWCEEVGCQDWDFWNVVQTPNCRTMTETDRVELLSRVRDRRSVVALGCWVSGVLTRNGIDHLKIDHPSPRNRNFNDPSYEAKMLRLLGSYVKGSDMI